MQNSKLVFFFSFNALNILLHSSCMPSCREVRCNIYLCSSVDKVYFFLLTSLKTFTLSLIFCSWSMICLNIVFVGVVCFCFVLAFILLVILELPGSVAGVYINLGKIPVIIVSNISSC